MSSLKELSQGAADLAIQVAKEHHQGQGDPIAKARVELAVEALLKAKRHLAQAHRHLNGDEPMSGVA